MSTIQIYESLNVTDNLQANIGTFATRIQSTQGIFQTGQVGTLSANQVFGTFYGNVVGTINGNSSLSGGVAQADKDKWDGVYTRVLDLSGGWQAAANSNSNWATTVELVCSKSEKWNIAYDYVGKFSQDINELQSPRNVIITRDTLLNKSHQNKRIIVTSDTDTFLELPSSNLFETFEATVVQFGAGRVFFSSENENLYPIFSKGNSNCLDERYSSTALTKLEQGWLLVGDVVDRIPFNTLNTVSMYWFCEQPDQDWFTPGNWYYDRNATLATNNPPDSDTVVFIVGYPPRITITSNNIDQWVNPQSINNTAARSQLIINADVPFTINSELISNSGVPFVYSGSASAISSTYYWYRSSIINTDSWFDKSCWFIKPNHSVVCNSLPIANSTVYIHENPNIVYAIDDPIIPSTSLPFINIDDNNSAMFVSPQTIDTTSVQNTFTMYISSTIPFTTTFNTNANDNFGFRWLGSITTGDTI